MNRHQQHQRIIPATPTTSSMINDVGSDGPKAGGGQTMSSHGDPQKSTNAAMLLPPSRSYDDANVEPLKTNANRAAHNGFREEKLLLPATPPVAQPNVVLPTEVSLGQVPFPFGQFNTTATRAPARSVASSQGPDARHALAPAANWPKAVDQSTSNASALDEFVRLFSTGRLADDRSEATQASTSSAAARSQRGKAVPGGRPASQEGPTAVGGGDRGFAHVGKTLQAPRDLKAPSAAGHVFAQQPDTSKPAQPPLRSSASLGPQAMAEDRNIKVASPVHARSDGKIKRRANNVSFPFSLHRMLEDAETKGFGHIVNWQPHGRAFKVHDSQRFTAQVLPRYFPLQTRYTSFVRQLNLYGIRRMVLRNGPDQGGYYHECLLRGMPHLIHNMQRQTRASRGSPSGPPPVPHNPLWEPDFSAMPPIEGPRMETGDARKVQQARSTSAPMTTLSAPVNEWEKRSDSSASATMPEVSAKVRSLSSSANMVDLTAPADDKESSRRGSECKRTLPALPKSTLLSALAAKQSNPLVASAYATPADSGSKTPGTIHAMTAVAAKQGLGNPPSGLRQHVPMPPPPRLLLKPRAPGAMLGISPDSVVNATDTASLKIPTTGASSQASDTAANDIEHGKTSSPPCTTTEDVDLLGDMTHADQRSMAVFLSDVDFSGREDGKEKQAEKEMDYWDLW